jgi:hypothetical protein
MASAAEFTIDRIDKRLNPLRADPWDDYPEAGRQTLPAARLSAVPV